MKPRTVITTSAEANQEMSFHAYSNQSSMPSQAPWALSSSAFSLLLLVCGRSTLDTVSPNSFCGWSDATLLTKRCSASGCCDCGTKIKHIYSRALPLCSYRLPRNPCRPNTIVRFCSEAAHSKWVDLRWATSRPGAPMRREAQTA